MDLTKIIKSGPNRIRLSSIGIKDLLAGSQDDMQNLNRSKKVAKTKLFQILILDTSKRISSILAMCFSQSHQICCHCHIIRRALVIFPELLEFQEFTTFFRKSARYCSKKLQQGLTSSHYLLDFWSEFLWSNQV